jgi:hypothetical protein
LHFLGVAMNEIQLRAWEQRQKDKDDLAAVCALLGVGAVVPEPLRSVEESAVRRRLEVLLLALGEPDVELLVHELVEKLLQRLGVVG